MSMLWFLSKEYNSRILIQTAEACPFNPKNSHLGVLLITESCFFTKNILALPPLILPDHIFFVGCQGKNIWKKNNVNNRARAAVYSKYELVAFGKGGILAPFCRTVELNEGG